jgi:FkbM family methyltransferase
LDILRILPSPPPLVRIIDVGAMMYGKDAYEPLLAARVARVVGFEPQAAECEKLNAAHAADGHTYLPYFIGDGSTGTFYQTAHAASSSLYEPNTALIENFQTLGEAYRVVSTTPVQTRRLDDIQEARPADLVKLDVQGAELDVIRGGSETIREALVVHSEVEFVPMYKDQPLLADVDRAMRELGFGFHKFYSIAGRAFAPLLAGNDPNRRISQMLWANAVYVRDFTRLAPLTPEQLIKLAMIAHIVYAAVDLAHFALAEYDRRRDAKGSALAPAYLASLTQPQPPHG